MRFETIAARGGRDVPSASRPLTPPLYQTNVFVFDSMAQVEAVWEGKEPGFVYGRYGTPNPPPRLQYSKSMPSFRFTCPAISRRRATMPPSCWQIRSRD